MRFPRSYDATTSRADFVRMLAQATDDPDWRDEGDRFVGRNWSLRLTPIAPLEIGSVRLERHRVQIDLHGMSAAQEEAFMRRFTLHYQRGGG